jgi:hypothetical protein
MTSVLLNLMLESKKNNLCDIARLFLMHGAESFALKVFCRLFSEGPLRPANPSHNVPRKKRKFGGLARVCSTS